MKFHRLDSLAAKPNIDFIKPRINRKKPIRKCQNNWYTVDWKIPTAKLRISTMRLRDADMVRWPAVYLNKSTEISLIYIKTRHVLYFLIKKKTVKVLWCFSVCTRLQAMCGRLVLLFGRCSLTVRLNHSMKWTMIRYILKYLDNIIIRNILFKIINYHVLESTSNTIFIWCSKSFLKILPCFIT